MPDQIPTRFDLLRPEGRQGEKFDEAIAALRTGVADCAIRKVVLDGVKSTLGRAADKAWERNVQEPFFYAGRYLEQPQEIQDLYHAVNVSSLHDCHSARKKIDRAGLEGPVIDAMNAVMSEALPLAEAVRDLKDHVVKGRAPNPNPPVPNPGKEIGTCSCCMRGIAVAGQGMAHHGYQRPGTGQQTSSCSGIRFPPLEVSTEGLEWLIGVTRDQLARTNERLNEVDTLTEIRWAERDRKSPNGFVQKICKSDEPDWPRVHRRYVANLQTEIRGTEGQIAFLGEELVKWQRHHGVEPVKTDDDPSP